MNYYLGMCGLFAGNFAIRDFGLCAGALVSINQNQALYAIIGTIYGGDGRINMALPDLRGRAAVSHGFAPGMQPYLQGNKGGLEFVTLNVTEMPVHTHAAAATGGGGTVTAPVTGTVTVAPSVNTGAGTTPNPENNYPANIPALSKSPINAYANSATDGHHMGASTGSINATANINIPEPTISVGTAGHSNSHENRTPYTVMNYLICMNGIFPSRN